MKITNLSLYTLVFAMLFALSATAHAEIANSNSSDAAQDTVAPGVVTNPSNQPAQDGPAGITSSPSTDLSQDGPTTPPQNPDNGSGNGGTNPGTLGGGSSGSGGSVLLYATSTTPSFVSPTCPLITDYLKIGGDNSPVQVGKLQSFLKNVEKADVIVNGTFDEKTEAAVMTFQKKYLDSVLGPWDATRATGFVYITTQKKINELACAQPLVLSADDLAVIAAYKSRGGSPDQPAVVVTAVTSDATTTLDAADLDLGIDNTAATADASILSRFWDFIKRLFR